MWSEYRVTYERLSVIITNNLPFENWTEVLGSERLTGAAPDRLTHRCHREHLPPVRENPFKSKPT